MNIGFNNYSFLFSNQTQNSGSFSYGINLGDYASIKNGSYGKLLKAYYGDNSSTAKSMLGSSINNKEEKKDLAKLQQTSDSLKESADALLTKGNKSAFNKKDITTKNEDGTTTTKNDYDTNAIYKNVKSFVDSYNSMVKAGGDAKSDSIVRQTYNMTKTTASYEKLLANVGISVGKDNQLTINEEDFKKANMEQVKSLFNTSGSYGYQVSAKASQINYTADKEAEKANTYNMNGYYNNAFSSGNIYNSYF